MSIEYVDDLEGWPHAAPKPVPAQSYFRGVEWTLRDLGIGVVPMIGMAILGIPIYLRKFPENLRWIGLPVSVGFQIWVFAYPLIVARKHRHEWPRMPRVGRCALEVLIALLFTPVIVIGTGLTALGVSRLTGLEMPATSPFEPFYRSPNRLFSVAVTVLGVVVAPLGEELFFRGFFYNALRQRLPFLLALVLQAVVFGLVHPFGVPYAGAIAFAAMGFALLYEWRKTLLAPILLHAFMNSASFAVLSWTVMNTPVLGVISDKSPEGCAIVSVAPGSSAESAGLRAGDVITSIDGQPVPDPTSLLRTVRGKPIGTLVPVNYIRNGKPQRVNILLKAMPTW